MNCYYATTQPAVGICKSCARGLSLEFATELKNGLACKGRCEDRATMIDNIIDSNTKVMSTANKQLIGNSYFTIILGILFIALAYFLGLPELSPSSVIFALLGGVYVVRGVMARQKSARFPTAVVQPPKDT